MLIPYPNEEWLAMTSDEDIIFFVYCDTIFGEDGDSAIVLPKLMREVGKSSQESAAKAVCDR